MTGKQGHLLLLSRMTREVKCLALSLNLSSSNASTVHTQAHLNKRMRRGVGACEIDAQCVRLIEEGCGAQRVQSRRRRSTPPVPFATPFLLIIL